MPAGIQVARKGFAAIKETGNLSTRLKTFVERYGQLKDVQSKNALATKAKPTQSRFLLLAKTKVLAFLLHFNSY